jgi:hypothetical protein
MICSLRGLTRKIEEEPEVDNMMMVDTGRRGRKNQAEIRVEGVEGVDEGMEAVEDHLEAVEQMLASVEDGQRNIVEEQQKMREEVMEIKTILLAVYHNMETLKMMIEKVEEVVGQQRSGRVMFSTLEQGLGFSPRETVPGSLFGPCRPLFGPSGSLERTPERGRDR